MIYQTKVDLPPDSMAVECKHCPWKGTYAQARKDVHAWRCPDCRRTLIRIQTLVPPARRGAHAEK